MGQVEVPASVAGHGVPGPPFVTVRLSPDSIVTMPLSLQPVSGNLDHALHVLPYLGSQMLLNTKR